MIPEPMNMVPKPVEEVLKETIVTNARLIKLKFIMKCGRSIIVLKTGESHHSTQILQKGGGGG